MSAERVRLTAAQVRVLALAAGHVDGRLYAQGRHISVCRALHAKNLISYAGMGHTCTIYKITEAGRAALTGSSS